MSGECYMQLGRCWDTNDTRKRIKLPLTIYRDFIQNFFIRFWEEGQYKPKATGAPTFLVWGRMSSLSFVQRTFDWDGWNGFVWRGRCRDSGTIGPQVSMPVNRGRRKIPPPLGKMFWMQFKTIGHSLKNLGPSQETLHPSNILSIHSLQSHMSCSVKVVYQSRASKHENWKAVENVFIIITKNKNF